MEPSNKKRRLAPKQPLQEQVRRSPCSLLMSPKLIVPSRPRPAMITSRCLLCLMPRPQPSAVISSPLPDIYKTRRCSSMPKPTNPHIPVCRSSSCGGRTIRVQSKTYYSCRNSSEIALTTGPSRGAYLVARTPALSSPCKWHSTLNMPDLITY